MHTLRGMRKRFLNLSFILVALVSLGAFTEAQKVPGAACPLSAILTDDTTVGNVLLVAAPTTGTTPVYINGVATTNPAGPSVRICSVKVHLIQPASAAAYGFVSGTGTATSSGVTGTFAYASGGTATGTGNCLASASNGAGTGAQGTIGVSSGTISGNITLTTQGSAYTASAGLPTTWTLSLPASGGASTCSGTVTTTGGSLAGACGGTAWSTNLSPQFTGTASVTEDWTEYLGDSAAIVAPASKGVCFKLSAAPTHSQVLVTYGIL